MILGGIVMVGVGGMLAWFGGPVGWVFGAVYVLAGLDSLWFDLGAARLRRRTR